MKMQGLLPVKQAPHIPEQQIEVHRHELRQPSRQKRTDLHSLVTLCVGVRDENIIPHRQTLSAMRADHREPSSEWRKISLAAWPIPEMFDVRRSRSHSVVVPVILCSNSWRHAKVACSARSRSRVARSCSFFSDPHLLRIRHFVRPHAPCSAGPKSHRTCLPTAHPGTQYDADVSVLTEQFSQRRCSPSGLTPWLCHKGRGVSIAAMKF